MKIETKYKIGDKVIGYKYDSSFMCYKVFIGNITEIRLDGKDIVYTIDDKLPLIFQDNIFNVDNLDDLQQIIKNQL